MKTFNSPGELAKELSVEVERIRGLIGGYLRHLQGIKARADREKRTKDFILKLLGGNRKPMAENIQGEEVRLDMIGVLINPSPEQEEALLEQLVESLQEKLNALERCKKALEPLLMVKESEFGALTTAIFHNGVPCKLILTTNEGFAEVSDEPREQTPMELSKFSRLLGK